MFLPSTEKGGRKMLLVRPSHEILFISPKPLETIEAAGRTCYKSEKAITETSAKEFVRKRVKDGHHSVIEHAYMSVRFICDRGVTHEIVRHRLAAYSQESTRYCNYKGGVTFIIPSWVNINKGTYGLFSVIWLEKISDRKWFNLMQRAEQDYIELLKNGWSPQQARSVLPNSLKTEIVMTANLREWMHVFKLRTSKAAHPQMRELMCPLLEEVYTKIPVLFENSVNLCADLRGE
jgi:thymidylate synthase (FAD)